MDTSKHTPHTQKDHRQKFTTELEKSDRTGEDASPPAKISNYGCSEILQCESVFSRILKHSCVPGEK
jgi:hypothetical protein